MPYYAPHYPYPAAYERAGFDLPPWWSGVNPYGAGKWLARQALPNLAGARSEKPPFDWSGVAALAILTGVAVTGYFVYRQLDVTHETAKGFRRGFLEEGA